MNRFSNIIDKSNKKGTIRLATVLTVLLIVALAIIISVPTINFATMPQTEDNSKLVPLDTPVKICRHNTYHMQRNMFREGHYKRKKYCGSSRRFQKQIFYKDRAFLPYIG